MGDTRLRCSRVARISAGSASATRWDHAVAPYEEPKLRRAARLGIARIEHPEFDRPEVDGPAGSVSFHGMRQHAGPGYPCSRSDLLPMSPVRTGRFVKFSLDTFPEAHSPRASGIGKNGSSGPLAAGGRGVMGAIF